MNRLKCVLMAGALFAAVAAAAEPVVVNMSDYGVRPGTKADMSPKVERALQKIAAKYGKEDVTLRFAPGRYEFHPEKAAVRTYYISNHDQVNPKRVGIDLQGWKSLVIDAEGADFVFHGRMLPLALVESQGCELRGFSIDFANPHIAQVTVEQLTDSGITFRPAPWVKWRVEKNGGFTAYGDGWSLSPRSGIAFDGATRRLVYRTSDMHCPVDSVVKLPDGALFAPRWRDRRLKPGTVVALRTGQRPAPGIFLDGCTAPVLRDVRVHYAEGMGLLAQLCDSVTLNGFSVCLRGDDDARYFTTQADATHFSGCKGHIDSRGGLYEGMMDDAINVHGTYLRITQVVDSVTVAGRYMHHQAYGFKWGEAGDSVQFIAPRTMEIIGSRNSVASIEPRNAASTAGAKEFLIRFANPVAAEVAATDGAGIENLSWCPSVTFANNTIRNNRARGSLFSTPRPTVVENNLFDHTSGTAILLCGDCNGWFETGACRDVIIRGNTFVNALTNLFQFTEAVISIYPEIPDLASQRKYFHGGEGERGIVIDGNRFVTFDTPLLYAKSVNGLKFINNKVETSADYAPFHSNRFTFWLQRVCNAVIEHNDFDRPQSVSFSVE